MNEKIILKVETLPKAEVTVLDPETRKYVTEEREVLEHTEGNHRAVFEKGGTVETESREFADLLIREFGLKEVKAEKIDTGDQGDQTADGKVDFLVTYPEGFPHKEEFAAAKIPYATAIGMNREQIELVPKIGKKKAEPVWAYIAALTGGSPQENDGDGGAE